MDKRFSLHADHRTLFRPRRFHLQSPLFTPSLYILESPPGIEYRSHYGLRCILDGYHFLHSGEAQTVKPGKYRPYQDGWRFVKIPFLMNFYGSREIDI